VSTNLDYFQYIVPCGLTKPVTSMAALGCKASTEEVKHVLVTEFSRQFERNLLSNELQPAVPCPAHI